MTTGWRGLNASFASRESSDVGGAETLRTWKGSFFGDWILRRPNGRVSEAETGKEN